MLKAALGRLVKNRRKELKITQPHLAELAKVSTNTLYKLERGQSNPSLDILIKLAEVLGMELKLEVKTLAHTHPPSKARAPKTGKAIK